MYTKTILDHYFKALLEKVGMTDPDCMAEIEDATQALAEEIAELKLEITELKRGLKVAATMASGESLI